MTGHNQRCEWSATPNAKCRCKCEGREHGIRRVRQQILADEAEENDQ